MVTLGVDSEARRPASHPDAGWWMLRAAVVTVGQPHVHFELELGRGDARCATVREVTLDGAPLGTVIISMVPLSNPPPAAPQPIEIDEDARKAAEELVEVATRLRALEMRTTHSIASPIPCLAVWCEDPKALKGLDGRAVNLDIFAASPQGSGGVGLVSRDDSHFDLIQDRIDGLALLTEALNARSPLGQYGQLMRLFERAFHRSPGKVEAILNTFLAGATYHNFECDEIHAWVNARGPAIHADRREEFLLDSDVRPLLPRMFEAGYDLLLNKTHWRSPSVDRRDAWKPVAGSANHHSGIFLTAGADASLRLQMLDPFAAYPLLVAGPIDPVLPRAAWLIADHRKSVLAIRGEAKWATG